MTHYELARKDKVRFIHISLRHLLLELWHPQAMACHYSSRNILVILMCIPAPPAWNGFYLILQVVLKCQGLFARELIILSPQDTEHFGLDRSSGMMSSYEVCFTDKFTFTRFIPNREKTTQPRITRLLSFEESFRGNRFLHCLLSWNHGNISVTNITNFLLSVVHSIQGFPHSIHVGVNKLAGSEKETWPFRKTPPTTKLTGCQQLLLLRRLLIFFVLLCKQPPSPYQ